MAKSKDAVGILSIYAPLVENTAISFEFKPPSLDEMRQRIENTIAERPWLVCEAEGHILGYAYASAYRSRGAYGWAVETSAYVGEAHQKKGIAKGLYHSLLKVLELQGYFTAYAGIALPNEASVKFHETMGYTAIGVFQQAGFKFGKWHDVGWWQRAIRNDQSMPTGLPKPVGELFGSAEWEEAMRVGMDLLKS